MVIITDGVRVYSVANSVYESMFKRMGFHIIEQEKMYSESHHEKTEDEIFVEEITEKPLNEWTKEEVKKYASIKDIDLSGTRNVAEAKNLIKESM